MKNLFVLLFVICLFSCSEKAKKPKPYTNSYTVQSSEVFHIDKETDSILKSIGIENISAVNKNDLPIYMKSIEKGIFENKSFCEYYKDYKMYEFQNDLKKSDEVVKPFSDNITLLTILGAYGYQLCPESLKEARIASKNPTYVPKPNYQESDLEPCIISKDFIKKDLHNPSTAEFSMLDCNKEKSADGSYIILRKVSAKNSFGVKKDFVYKVRLGFLGGNSSDIKNWKLISIASEEYK